MSGFAFLTPALAWWGLGAAAIPIVIHLLFRRRYRVVEWAPMKYLKLVVQKRKKKMQVEQWILLALRCLAALLLFLAVARPNLSAGRFAALLGGAARTSRVVVLDDSLSMGARLGDATAFERAKGFVADLVRATGARDRVTIAVSSNLAVPLRRDVPLGDPAEQAKLAEEIAALAPGDHHTLWSNVFESADRLLAAGAFPTRELLVVTDLRAAGWDRRVAETGAKWQGAQLPVRIVDAGGEPQPNLALLDFAPADRLTLVGAPTRWYAEIANQSRQTVAGKSAILTLDGKPREIALPDLAPNATIKLPVPITFQEPGRHRVSFALPADGLLADNRRQGVVEAKESLSILVVDGEPSSQPFEGETDFLAVPLTLSASWRVEVVGDAAWNPAANGDDFDLVILANVAAPTAAQADWLKRVVRRGAGLMVFPGDQVQPDAYNRLLHDDGRGPLPGLLEAAVAADAAGLLVEDLAPSPLEMLGQVKRSALERIRPRKLQPLKPDAKDTRVLAKWNDPAGTPAAIEKSFGAGRCLYWTVTADRAWSDWPVDPTYVLAVREAAKALARGGAGGTAGIAGEPLRLAVADGAVDPVVETPAGGDPRGAATENAGVPGERAFRFDATHRAGFYRLAWKEAEPKALDFAVNPDARESASERVGAVELNEVFGGLRPEIVALGTADRGPSAGASELWRTAVLALIALLVAESAFAAWMGRQR